MDGIISFKFNLRFGKDTEVKNSQIDPAGGKWLPFCSHIVLHGQIKLVLDHL